MSNFESFLAQKLEEYVTYRKNLDYAKEGLRPGLNAFDRYLKEQNADWDDMQPSFFLQLRSNMQKHPNTVNVILSAIRGFFNFLIRQGLYTHNPLQDVPPLPETYFIPFVFSPEETNQLLKEVSKRIRNTKEHFLRDVALYLAILLLARCGMRIMEPLRLQLTQYRADDGTIYIERTKFRKDRLIPLPISVMTEIENYLCVRRSLSPHNPNPYLLAWKDQKGIKDWHVRNLFHRSVKDIGLSGSKQTIGNVTFGYPTPHSLRHAFAINTLKRIKGRGESTQHALPVLAAYMGHRKYQYTHAYLKVPDAKHLAGLIAFSKSQL
ncbi:MAG: tyrosine-type recombinase/integrase, partial [Deltaproteobacteria bacterium]|nr:tyrosine-type recombinase/integrase [Deltaproteobacteria bacterium]